MLARVVSVLIALYLIYVFLVLAKHISAWPYGHVSPF